MPEQLSHPQPWFKSNFSVELDPSLSVCRTLNHGLGLQVENYKGDRSEEQVVLTVSKSLVLSASLINEMAKTDPVLSQWLDVEPRSANHTLQRGLLYLWKVGKNSKWKEYLETLPTDIDLPYGYSIHKMENLDSANLSVIYASMSKRLEIERSYERFMNLKTPESSQISLNDWILPFKWISSRGLTHPETEEVCLVPVVDLCNHSSNYSNCRYEINDSGDFELRLLASDTSRPGEPFELTLNYGMRGSAEFLFNYGFIPDDRGDNDFEEVTCYFYPGCDKIRDLIDPGRVTTNVTDEERVTMSLAYDVLLDFFAEHIPQQLRIVVLPEDVEPNEQNRFRFHNNFIMALACEEYLELVREDDDDVGVLYLDNKVLEPTHVFEALQSLNDPEVFQKARDLVAKLCRHFATLTKTVSSCDPLISKLASIEHNVYERYAEVVRCPVGDLDESTPKQPPTIQQPLVAKE